MVDFSALLATPVDDVKRPPSLPAGSYNGTIIKYEFLESKEKKTPYVQFQVRLDSAGEGIDPEDLEFDGKPIDLSKKVMRQDFYLTADSMWRLKEFIETFGIATAGRSFNELIPELINQPVLCEVTQQINQKDPTAPAYNNIAKMVGQG